MRVDVIARELTTGSLEPSTVTAVVEALDRDGYVIVGRVVSDAVLDAMRKVLTADTAELRRRWRAACDDADFPFHVSQPMPCVSEHVHRDVVANRFVTQVTEAVLGAGVHNHFYNCNVNLPGSDRQALHRDAPHLWIDPIHPTTSIVVNVCPVDVDERNGATELWPGTHRLLGATRVTPEAEADRRCLVQPVRATTRRGDVLLRDPRLWHRATPNHGTEPRHMVAMVHSKWFYERDTCIRAVRGAVEAFSNDRLTTKIHVVPDDYDHLAAFFDG